MRHTNMRLKINRSNKLIICLFGLLSVFALASSNLNESFVKADATNTVEGYYAKASDDANIADNLRFVLEENNAPYNADLSVKYKAESLDSIKILRDNGSTVYLPNDYIGTADVLIKCTATDYLIIKDSFATVGGIGVGDTIILNGNFVRDDCTLHIKESKLYVYRENVIVTIPHKVNNLSPYLESVKSGKEAQNRDWYFLIWPDELPYEAMLQTGDDGYYPTSIHNVYVNGEAHGNCVYDALRRRDDWGREIYICAATQIGTDNPKVGTVVVIDGVFNYKNYGQTVYPMNPVLELEPGESFGIEVNLLALLKVGGGIDDYVQIDLKEYLIDQFNLLYDTAYYDPNYYNDIIHIYEQLGTSLASATTAKEVYSIYNYCASEVEAMELSEDGFEAFKNKYIREITEYVDLSSYLEKDVPTVEGYINNCLSIINSATKTKQVVDAVNDAKSSIDAIKTRLDLMEEAIINLTDGYKNFLQPYDQVTLNDLSLGDSQSFHGRKAERENDMNTNIVDEKNQFNTFATSPNNPTGNLVFNFKYKSNVDTPKGLGNVSIILRGIRYYGYKFCMGTDSKGLFFQRVYTADENQNFKGAESVFTNVNSEYRVSLTAIDLIEGNRTWIRIQVNGLVYVNQIVDSFFFCNNPRVSISGNLNADTDIEGVSTISNYYPNSAVSNLEPIYCGRLEAEPSRGDSLTTMHLTMSENRLKYDGNGVFGYSLNPSNIKLIRDNTTYEIGRSDVPVLGKFSSTSYKLLISELLKGNDDVSSIENGDKIVISGNFAYFDGDADGKTLFEIGKSTFVYDASKDMWNSEVSLEDAKTDAIRKLNYYSSESFLSIYDDAGRAEILRIVNDATETINNADTVSKLAYILNNVSNLIGQVKTSFENYQDSIVNLISSYKETDQNLYRKAEWKSIQTIKEDAIYSVQRATTSERVEEIYNKAIDDIDAVLTDEEMTENELKDAKYEAIRKIKNRYASVVKDSMSDEELNTLNNETLRAIENVNNASNINEVNSIVKAYMSAHPLPNSGSSTSSNGCGGNIVTSSMILSILALCAFVIVLLRKRKFN